MFENESSTNQTGQSSSHGQVSQTGSFLGKSGKLYIQVPRLQPTPSGEKFHDQTAVYPSIEAYNARSAKPEYTTLKEIQHDFLKPVAIDMNTLLIGLPLPA